jgi:hypothetical protein
MGDINLEGAAHASICMSAGSYMLRVVRAVLQRHEEEDTIVAPSQDHCPTVVQ